MDKDFGKKVLDTIKQEKIKPKPRWEFLLKDYFLWALFLVAVFVGSISVSIIIFVFQSEILDRPAPPQGHPMDSLIFSIPYFWLLVLALFLVIAYFNFRYTKSGYRYNALKVFLASIVLSIIFGAALHVIGLSHRAERATYDRIPLYKNIMEHRAQKMISPEDGHLGGIFINKTEEFIELKAFDGKIWQVDVSSLEEEEISEILFEPGIRIMILGEQISDNEFLANELMMWLKPHRFPMYKKKINYLYERNNDEMRIIR